MYADKIPELSLKQNKKETILNMNKNYYIITRTTSLYKFSDCILTV